jgi:hypothetical protein
MHKERQVISLPSRAQHGRSLGQATSFGMLTLVVSTEATQKTIHDPSRSRPSYLRNWHASCLSFGSSNISQKQKDVEIERLPVKSYQSFLYLCGWILEAGDLDAITACLRHGSYVHAWGGPSEEEALGWPPWREVGGPKRQFRPWIPPPYGPYSKFKVIPQLSLRSVYFMLLTVLCSKM